MKAKELKSALLQKCQEALEKRYHTVKSHIKDIEESLLEESKNTSGDKHETGRAMLQIERENAGKQLQEIERERDFLKRIDINTNSDYARLGSLAHTDRATYFISSSIGAVPIGNTTYYCVAYSSPIGQLLSGKKKGDSFSFQDKSFTISSIR